MSHEKPLLVGEDNPYGQDPRYALYPYPPRSAGARLCQVILDLTLREYLRAFERVNLCVGKWSMREARSMAFQLKVRAYGRRPLVLLGSKVAEAFGIDAPPFSIQTRTEHPTWEDVQQVYVLLPHPSGRCRIWNKAGAMARARALVLPLIEKVPA